MTISNQNPYGPLTPSGLLQRTFAMYRERPRVIFGLVLIVAAAQIAATGVMTSMTVWMHRLASGRVQPIQMLLLFCIFALAMLLVYLVMQVVQGAFFYAVTAWIEAQAMLVGDACRSALERRSRLIGVSVQILLRVIGYLVLVGIGIGVIGVLLVLLLHAGIGESLHGLGWMGKVFLLAPVMVVLIGVYGLASVWVMARYAVSIPACLAENLAASAAVRRSIALTAKSKSRIYALYAGIFFLSLASLMIVLPLRLLAMQHGGHTPWASLMGAVASAVNLFFGAWMITFTGIATTLCYYDLRARKDGMGKDGLGAAVPASDVQTDTVDAPMAEVSPLDSPPAETQPGL